MKIENVLVAGPNGNLGKDVVKHLLHNGFHVSLLTRNAAETAKSFPDIPNVLESDYSSVAGLTQTLQQATQPFDAVVCLINRFELAAQRNLIDASVAAAVPHIVPSHFGSDMASPAMRALPAFEDKIAMEEHLLRQVDAGRLTFTGVNCAVQFEWAMRRGLLLNLADDGRPVSLYDGGTHTLSVSGFDTVGRAVAAVLLRRDEFVNRFVNVHAAVVTQKQLLDYAREAAPGRKFEVEVVDLDERVREAQRKLDEGDRSFNNLRWFMMRAQFGGIHGAFKRTDNALLGIEEWNEAQIKSIVAQFV